MKDVEQAAEAWLVANDWDYQKYGDKRADRSAYGTLMNYEISGYLSQAFEAGATWQRSQDAAIAEKFVGDLNTLTCCKIAQAIREQTFDVVETKSEKS